MGEKSFSTSKYEQAKLFLGSTIKGGDYSDFLTVKLFVVGVFLNRIECLLNIMGFVDALLRLDSYSEHREAKIGLS